MDKRSLLFLVSVTAAFFLVKLWYGPTPAVPLLPQPPISAVVIPSIEAKPATVSSERGSSHTYYVLSNDYQQLVFSSVGGSIVEINLPFKSKEFSQSIVLPVELDRSIEKRSAKDNLFPAVTATTYNGHVVSPTPGNYYPLLRRTDSFSPSHAACALTSQYAEFSSLPYRVTEYTPTSITFEARQPHRIVRKTFSFPKDPSRYPYCFNLTVHIEGDSKDIALSSGIPEVEMISGASGATLKYRVLKGTKADVEKVDLPKTTFTSSTIQPDWVCNSNGFFGIIVDPIQGTPSGLTFSLVSGSEAPSRILSLNSTDHQVPADTLPGYEAKIPLPSTESSTTFRVFAGPLSDSVLSTIDENSITDSAKPTNYVSCQTFHGWFSFISEPFAKIIFVLMKFFHQFFGSWVLAIILVTIVLRILLYPLNQWSIRSMRAMQEIGPKVKALQEKYRKDPQRAQREVMALYREQKVNPFSGCLPMIIQMPFVIGMFDLLRSSFELRGAPFIPGWINDLAAPDVLLEWKYHIPLIGNQLHVLPLLLGATMWLQQSLSSTLPKNQKDWTEQQRQQRAMGTIMTVVMTVVFYQFPAGLNIYWISSTILGIVQQWWSNRQYKIGPVKGD